MGSCGDERPVNDSRKQIRFRPGVLRRIRLTVATPVDHHGSWPARFMAGLPPEGLSRSRASSKVSMRHRFHRRTGSGRRYGAGTDAVARCCSRWFQAARDSLVCEESAPGEEVGDEVVPGHSSALDPAECEQAFGEDGGERGDERCCEVLFGPGRRQPDQADVPAGAIDEGAVGGGTAANDQVSTTLENEAIATVENEATQTDCQPLTVGSDSTPTTSRPPSSRSAPVGMCSPTRPTSRSQRWQ